MGKKNLFSLRDLMFILFFVIDIDYCGKVYFPVNKSNNT